MITIQFHIHTVSKNKPALAQTQNIHILHLQVQTLHFINLKISRNAAVTFQVNYYTTLPTTQPKHTKTLFL